MTIENRISKYIYRIAEALRSIAVLNDSSLRISASNTWENNGFSYVMTVSCVNTSSLNYENNDAPLAQSLMTYSLYVSLRFRLALWRATK